MNLLFVANKPQFISSNAYLSRLKKQYKEQHAGFCGTLDPFACGALIVGFGQFARLFQFIPKSPKIYRATLFLGLNSDSLDIENIRPVSECRTFKQSEILSACADLKGEIEYFPPKFSAKHINGTRAYKLARAGLSVDLPKNKMTIFNFKILNYCHPFLSFEVSLSEGGFVRSIGEIIAQNLGVCGALSYLERLCEGELRFNKQKPHTPLNPLEILPFPVFSANNLKNEAQSAKNSELHALMKDGKKFDIRAFLPLEKDGKFIVEFADFFSICELQSGELKYLLNRISLC